VGAAGGPAEGRAEGTAEGPAEGQGQEGPAAAQGEDGQPDEQPDEPPEDQPETASNAPGTDEPPPDPEPPEPGRGIELAETARPLADVPVRDAVTVPDFIGEGAGERRTTPVAGLGEATRPTERERRAPAGAGAPEEPPPPDVAEPATFERALEAALRARHLAPEERPVVRAWFERLVEESR